MKRFYIVVLLCILFLNLYSQQKPTYEKKVYKSPDGKLFVNKELPVYVWLSTSPDESAQKYRLISEEMPQYSNPMYFDTDGYNTLRSPSAVDTSTHKTIYPLRDVVFEIYADRNTPVTKIDFGESTPFTFEGKLFVQSNTKISLLSSDALSGVENIYYSLDGADYTIYNQALTLSQEKEYTLKYYAVDHVGNVEETAELKLVYDKTAPATQKTVSTDEYNNIISARSKIVLKAEDVGIGVSKIVYRIDDGEEKIYNYPISASYLSQGEHKINYYSVDKVGNNEAEQSYTFYIDKSAPTIIEEIIAKTFFANGKEYASGKAQLKLTAFDNKAGIKEIRYSINDGEYQVYEKPVFLTQTAGSLVIKTYAVDNVNNKSQSQTANEKTSIPYIDLAGPTLSHYTSGPKFETRDTLFINNQTKINLKARDGDAGISRIEYRIDGKENLEYSGAFQINDEGVHTISFVGYDNVENTSSSTFIVKVDNTGPELNYEMSIAPTGKENNLDIYPDFVTMYLSGSDKNVGIGTIQYGFNEATPKSYTIPISGFMAGEKQIKLVATDKLGNTTEKIVKFIVRKE
ncbi:MAG: chitobiase/beta-hexosaminidase C-terminal domain-containing protein [Bacteroidales bacterium]|nr:chitobiase/beta-hexosaminidase C-terminal domain-containing protein [Bacteroidales bacterium]